MHIPVEHTVVAILYESNFTLRKPRGNLYRMRGHDDAVAYRGRGRSHVGILAVTYTRGSRSRPTPTGHGHSCLPTRSPRLPQTGWHPVPPAPWRQLTGVTCGPMPPGHIRFVRDRPVLRAFTLRAFTLRQDE